MKIYALPGEKPFRIVTIKKCGHVSWWYSQFVGQQMPILEQQLAFDYIASFIKPGSDNKDEKFYLDKNDCELFDYPAAPTYQQPHRHGTVSGEIDELIKKGQGLGIGALAMNVRMSVDTPREEKLFVFNGNVVARISEVIITGVHELLIKGELYDCEDVEFYVNAQV